jgi:CheY-like chemotaxis protein
MPIINVVDDDESTRYMLRLMLEREGYDVVEAESGEECLETFDHLKPDLILLDITMTGINGWEVCRQIKERMPNILVPISILSARKTEEDIKRSMEYAHADAHIKKPVDRKELLDTVKILLENFSTLLKK